MRISTLLRSAEDKTVALAAKAKPATLKAVEVAGYNYGYYSARAKGATARVLRNAARRIDTADRIA